MSDRLDSAARLQARIRLGEDSLLELKQVAFAGGKVRGPGQDALADELAAFANASGGTLILGVDDSTREVTGIPPDRLDDVVRFVSQACQDSVEPPLDVTVERMELRAASGKARCIVRVWVGRSLFVHRSPGGYLRRHGDSKRQVPSATLARLFQERSQAGLFWFDESIVSGAGLGDLDAGLVGRFRTDWTIDSPDVLAEKLGLALRNEIGELKPTLAGIVVASDQPQRWLPNAFIQAVAYRGTSVSDALNRDLYQLDACDIGGPLDRQVAEACRFVVRNQRVAASKTIGRRDYPQFDITAVFEAVVNAVAHRDYSIRGSKIRLRLFSDRLEVYSPGGPPNGVTLDALAWRQASRNNTVTSLLARTAVPDGIPSLRTSRRTLMDRRGEGVGVILRLSEELSGRLPEYDLLDDAELRLTIFSAAPQDI